MLPGDRPSNLDAATFGRKALMIQATRAQHPWLTRKTFSTRTRKSKARSNLPANSHQSSVGAGHAQCSTAHTWPDSPKSLRQGGRASSRALTLIESSGIKASEDARPPTVAWATRCHVGGYPGVLARTSAEAPQISLDGQELHPQLFQPGRMILQPGHVPIVGRRCKMVKQGIGPLRQGRHRA
jgi:hypothetical protein